MVSRFVDSIDTVWVGNDVPDVHRFTVEDGSCFDPGSDMDAPADEGETEEGLFCS